MNATTEVPVEERIHSAFSRGDLEGAATTLLHFYGAEIFGFLVARLRNTEMASEAFADFTEDLWRGLAGFRWMCSARAWAYTLARHAASRAIRQRRRRGAHVVPLSNAGPISELAERVRSETAVVLRTKTRNRFAELREQLPVGDQMLLLLRVNRGLAWLDIARIMARGTADEAIDLPTEALTTQANRLRKRFQKAKEKLRRMAEEAGLLSD
jgi:RNA polymerase sigma-70 factor (ECF subfamily)